MSRPFSRSLGPALFLSLFIPFLSSCRDSSTGGPAPSFEVLSATTASGIVLPGSEVFLNDIFLVNFNVAVDPATVNTESFRIRILNDDDAPPPPGDFVVEGNRVRFVTTLPVLPDLSDTALAAGTDYTLSFRVDEKNPIRSLNGVDLTVDFSVEFRTRVVEPLLRDPVVGVFDVGAFGLDLDGDGTIAADGDLDTPDPEEFQAFDNPGLVEETPVGLARAPLTFGFLVTKPILPASLLATENPLVTLTDVDRQVQLPFELVLEQSFVPERDRYVFAILVRPELTLPPGTRVEARLAGGVLDVNGNDLAPHTLAVVTATGPGSFEDAFVEDFSDDERKGSETTAAWDVNDAGVLEAGAGIGGSGADGRFFVSAGETRDLNTALQPTILATSVNILGTLNVTGPEPLRIFATEEVTIDGTINVRGERGQPGIRRGGNFRIRGGEGGPGGGRGGNANDPPDIPLSEDDQQRGFSGESPVVGGGGVGGLIGFSFAGGGGGGGHAEAGGMSPGSAGATGGIPYGDAEITMLLGGSGGGGGGDGSRNDDPPDESTGGGGGGGGGALFIECGATLELNGNINADGGNGGPGGSFRGQTPGGGGGGGGSGGAVKLRSLIFLTRENAGLVVARGGIRGSTGGGGSRNGGAGSPGRIRLETLDVNRNGTIDPEELILPETVDPAPSIAPFDRTLLGTSVAVSTFRNTGTANPRYTAFDATDPATGNVILGPGVQDLEIPDGIPPSATVRVMFEGADADLMRPALPDPETATGFVPDITALDGKQFVRYRIDFDIGPEFETAPRPVVTKVQVRFAFDIE